MMEEPTVEEKIEFLESLLKEIQSNRQIPSPPFEVPINS